MCQQAPVFDAELFDFAPVTYALLDSAGVVLKVNLAGSRLLNVERAHLIGHPLLPFIVQQDRRELLEHLRRCRSEKSVVESEVRFASTDERPVTCRLYSKRASYAERDVFPTIIIDQTEHLALYEARLAAERRREQAEREADMARAASATKDRFLATVSHELRTPLTPALIAASRLATWVGLSGKAQKLADTIKRNIELEARLIDDLLDVARVNRDCLDVRVETVDAHDVLRDAIGISGSAAEAKGVAVEVQLTATSHHVRGDAVRLRQVFWNLLNNAIKFTEAGGRVILRSVNIPGDILRMTVHDSGVGMDSTVVEKLFAPFEHRPVPQEGRSGLGLGLAICKGIIGAHSGQICATSDGPGCGSTFAVELATVQPERGAEARAEQLAPSPEPGQEVL